LVDGKECAYTVFVENGTAYCGIEKAFEAGITGFRKPISCHLYPVRLKYYRDFTAVQYHRWEICSAACKLGEKLKIPLYRFLKEPLIRKFGPGWYAELEAVAEAFQREQL
jgi:predicted GIY-YIG superfamily endonuclease